MDGYILLSHGSKVKASNEESFNVLEELRKNIQNIELAFLELAEPDFENAVKLLKKAGATSIKVLPLFLAPGKHVKEDIPSLSEVCSKKYKIEITVLEHIGANSGYVKLIEDIFLSGR
ncbi:CbiX/SirB N-terminal domain-containing protein [Sulfurimonas sp.]|uniref:sirohydrochlorin chelatase n=1 Tax=Sulfurimonas sp. TaxID=2022749 RepID=UPI0019EF2CC4|nr:CbiX/SirB N-terminal domain-containing protein [Sulfurimonas sp.]MBE0513670.1 CbiX/SirB N-terminal domain-containing protein [Sulfurimonas sp.]